MIDELEKKQSEMPSAFPNGNLFPGNRGLTMRDAFAMNAPLTLEHLADACFARDIRFELQRMWQDLDSDLFHRHAELCYKWADAMMLAREKS